MHRRSPQVTGMPRPQDGPRSTKTVRNCDHARCSDRLPGDDTKGWRPTRSSPPLSVGAATFGSPVTATAAARSQLFRESELRRKLTTGTSRTVGARTGLDGNFSQPGPHRDVHTPAGSGRPRLLRPCALRPMAVTAAVPNGPRTGGWCWPRVTSWPCAWARDLVASSAALTALDVRT
jgi:hypothetical protein